MTTYPKQMLKLTYSGEHTVSLEVDDTILEMSFGDPGEAQVLYNRIELHIRKKIAGIRE